MSLRLLKKRLCVRPEQINTTLAGLVIPEIHATDTNRAHVVAAGPDARCKPGDRVIIGEWAHVEIDPDTCHRLGEEPGLRFVHEDVARMRCEPGGKWQAMPGVVLVKLDAKASLFDEREGSGIIPVSGFIGLGDEERLVAAQPTTGVVLLAGEGCDCKPGDRVQVGKYNGCEMEARTLAELGVEDGAHVWAMREIHTHEITAPSGRVHAVVADDVHAILEAACK
jgi:co-chaperonin GroES (HSP10)